MKAMKQAFTELLTVVLALTFSVNYKPPQKLKKILSSPEFVAFSVFAILYLQLGNDPLRASLWAGAWFLVDKAFRDAEK
tara:strand:- start:266 stop:502 length:237 start_codon:yes stop_codon:yes gene_type:complete